MKNFNLFGFSGSETYVTRGAKSLVFKGTRTHVFGGVKFLLLALTLLCGVNEAWGACYYPSSSFSGVVTTNTAPGKTFSHAAFPTPINIATCDAKQGASQISLTVSLDGSGTDKGAKVKVSYSTNSGSSWNTIGSETEIDKGSSKSFSQAVTIANNTSIIIRVEETGRKTYSKNRVMTFSNLTVSPATALSANSTTLSATTYVNISKLTTSTTLSTINIESLTVTQKSGANCFTPTWTNATISCGDTKDLSFTYLPTDEGNHSAVYTVTGNGKSVDITITGTAKRNQVNFNLNYEGANQTNLFTGWTGSVTSNGVTMTYDPATGYITLNGTSTASTSNIIQELPGINTGDIISYAATDYSGSRTPANGCQVFEPCNVSGTNPSSRQNLDFTGNATKTNQTILDGYNYMKFWIWYNSTAVTYTNLKFKLRIEKGSSLASVAAPSGKYVTYNNTFGTMPTPTREGYQFEGWYTEPTCQLKNKVTSDTKFTSTSNQVLYANWVRALKPEYTYTGANAYNVGDASLDLSTLWTTNSDGAKTYSIVSFTPADGEQSGSTAPAITNNKLSLGQAGTLVIKLSTPKTDAYEDGETTQTITISRIANTLAWSTTSISMNYNQEASVQVTNKNSGATITYSVSPENAGRYDATSGKFYSYNQNVDVTLQAVQAETYKYKSTTITIPIYIRPAADGGCYIINESIEEQEATKYKKEWNNEIVGVAGILYYTSRSQDFSVSAKIWVIQCVNGQWSQVGDQHSIGGSSQDFEQKLDPNATGVTFGVSGTLEQRVKGTMQLTRTTFLTPTETEFSMTKIRGKGAITHTLNVNYSTCNAGQKITVMSDNPNITVSPASVTMNNSGTAQFTITYVDLAQPHDDEATLTVFNPTYTTTVNVHGKTTGVIAPTVTNTLPSSRMVDDAAIDLNSYWTTNSDAPMQFSFEFTPSGSTDGSKGVTLTGSTLTFGQAGSLKVKMHTNATNFYTEYNGEKTITISRYANPVTVTIDGFQTLERYIGLDGTHTINTSSANTRTKVLITPNTSNPTPVLPPSQAAESSLPFTTGLTEGDATFTISQAQDYKYEAASATATVHVGQGNVCTIADEYSTEQTITSYNHTFTAGEGHVWTFAAKKGTVSSVTAQEYYSGSWHDLATLNLNDSYQYYNFVLNPNATRVQINGIQSRWPGTNYDIVIKNAKITKYTTITPHNGQALNMSKIKGEADLDSIITITQNTCGEIKVQVSGANAGMFTVTAVQGQTNTYKVTYKKCDIAATHTANITFYDQNTKATMTVNGETTEMQDPVWKCDIADNYNVEQTTLDLQALWTSNQSDAAPYSARQYSIVFTPDGDNHDGATGVNLTDNRYLTLGDAGTVKITMTQAANAFYYAKTETKTVTINRRSNTMTFSLGGTQGTTATMNLGEGMMTYINTTNTTDTIYAEQTDGFKSGTYYRNWNAVYAAATKGTMTVRAWQDQTYKYEAAEGSFTITVEEMPMTQCEALTYTQNITLNDNGYTTTALNLNGEGNVLTYNLGVQYLGNQVAGQADNDSTRYWIEYKTATSEWQMLGEKALPADRNNITIANFPADATQIRFDMEKAAKYQETQGRYTYDRTTTLTFSAIHVSRATYVKVGTDEASVAEGDITLPEMTMFSGQKMPQQEFVIAYSTCDQTSADHIRIQCNKGDVIQFSQDNINTEDSPSGTVSITADYTPTKWGKDTAIVAVYNRSVRRRVYIPLNVQPYTFTGAKDDDWSKTDNWADGKKPASTNNCGVVVAGDATLNENATVGSIEVAKDATLTIAHGKKLTVDGSTQPLKPATTYGNIRVQADATLLVKAGSLNINKLDLEGGLYGSEGKFGVPYVQLNSTASIYRNNTEIDYYLNVLPSSYYAFAVPFEVPFNKIGYAQNASVTYDKANYRGSAIDIRLYDGAARATENTSTANNSKYWKSLLDEQGKLKIGQGYIISARKLKGANFAELKLTMNVANPWLTGGEQGQVGDVVRNAMDVQKNAGSGSTRWNNKGWNFIANPFLSSNKIAEEQLALLYAQDSVGTWGDFEPNTNGIKYVTLPNYDMTDYNQISAEELGDTLQPFMPFFIQAANDDTLQFNSVHKYAAPARWNARPTSTYPEQRIYLSLRGNEMKESLGLMIQEDYTAEYDYNADLVKMLGEANTLRGYLTYGNNDMAYLALNETLAEEAIPMTVRIPAMNLYTWSLKESSRTDMLDAVYLTDVVENKVINLLNEDYTFSANEGLLQGRFFLNAVLNPNRQPTDIRDAANATDEDAQKMIFRNHLYIVHKGIVYDGQGQRIMQIKK